MPKTLFRDLIYSTVRITYIDSEGEPQNGTGFITYFGYDDNFKTAHKIALITNKHVVKDIKSFQLIFCTHDGFENVNDLGKFVLNYGANNWIMHPNKSIDLACLNITDLYSCKSKSYNELNKLTMQSTEMKGNMLKGLPYYKGILRSMYITDDELKQVDDVEDVYMIGYPDGIVDTVNNKPVVRKGITATSIRLDYNGKPEFLADIAAFPGSSGSPVFLVDQCFDVVTTSKEQNGSISLGKSVKFIGVLSSGTQHRIVIDDNYVDMPNNLGVIIKAKEILAFEDLLV